MSSCAKELIRPIQMLYPTSRQFPFDEAAERIVRELERRNWDVPGIEVKLDRLGTGERKLAHVFTIRGKDFRLLFGRLQNGSSALPWSNIVVVTTLTIPGFLLDVFEDESGPTLSAYVGDDYEADREAFITSTKVNARYYNQPRMYLTYGGLCRCDKSDMGHTHRGRRSPLLVHREDYREYEPVGNEPREYSTNMIIVDHAAYEERCAEIRAQPSTGPRFSTDQLLEMFQARFNTFTPITKHKGGYKQPVVLIGRELELDEVEIVLVPPL